MVRSIAMTVQTALGEGGWRPGAAVAICALAAVWGVVAVALGPNHASRDILWVAATWGAVGAWLDGFRSLRKTPAQIYQDARAGHAQQTPLRKTIRNGSAFLLLLAILSLFR